MDVEIATSPPGKGYLPDEDSSSILLQYVSNGNHDTVVRKAITGDEATSTGRSDEMIKGWRRKTLNMR